MNKILFIIMLTVLVLLAQEARTPIYSGITIKQCLMQAKDNLELDKCLPPVVKSSLYDLYKRRYDELLWKNVAY